MSNNADYAKLSGNADYAKLSGNADYAKLSGNAVPVGTLIDFAGSTAPTGYLVCNGSAVSRTTYADLFSVIGILYGAGDGSTTFALPNLIDIFKEGSSTAGTYKSAGLPNINGEFVADRGSSLLIAFSGAFYSAGTYTDNTHAPANWVSDSHNIAKINFDASKSNSIYGASTTVQPPALTVLPCIKY